MIETIKKNFIYFVLLMFMVGCNDLMDEYKGDDLLPLGIDVTICDILSNTENVITGYTWAYDSLSLVSIYDTLSGDTTSFTSLSNSNSWKLPLVADTCFFMIYAPQQADSYFVVINSSSGLDLYNKDGVSVEPEDHDITLTNVAGCPAAKTRKVYVSLSGVYLARVINSNVSSINLVLMNTNSPPVSFFNASPLNVTIGDTVSFTDQSTKGSYPIVSHYWDFGDGSGSSDSSFVQHAYSDSGKFSPTITVSDGYLSSSLTKTELVTVLGGSE